MTPADNLKLLFVINARSGSNNTDWVMLITNYFAASNHSIDFYELTKDCTIQTIKDKIKIFKPHQVIAVGGDGTIKLVAECILKKNMALGILPAGSANGMARELGISTDPAKALDILVAGHSTKIHLTTVNDHICIHLSDIGLNAFAMKKFDTQRVRGMWGYFVASLKVLWQNPVMQMNLEIDGEVIKVNAEMIVIANATKYGNGVVINPIGKLNDKLFEVIAVKKISFHELLKMIFLKASYDPNKTEVFQTNELYMRSASRVHFQVDGEYLGKVREVKAAIIPDALHVIVPEIMA